MATYNEYNKVTEYEEAPAKGSNSAVIIAVFAMVVIAMLAIGFIMFKPMDSGSSTPTIINAGGQAPKEGDTTIINPPSNPVIIEGQGSGEAPKTEINIENTTPPPTTNEEGAEQSETTPE